MSAQEKAAPHDIEWCAAPAKTHIRLPLGLAMAFIAALVVVTTTVAAIAGMAEPAHACVTGLCIPLP